MQKTILSDTSCLILLEKIGELELLHEVFGEILITQEVADEYGLNLPHWISVQNPTNKTYQKILEASVDKGEASAIIDDLKGRNLAETLGIKITGTLGVILEAKLSGKIKSVKPLLIKIKQTDFHFPEELEKKILAKANEN
jgi:predicted nucleic acid-binding protein